MPGWFQLEAQACHDVPLCIPIFARLRRLFQTLCFSKVAKPDHALNRAQRRSRGEPGAGFGKRAGRRLAEHRYRPVRGRPRLSQLLSIDIDTD